MKEQAIELYKKYGFEVENLRTIKQLTEEDAIAICFWSGSYGDIPERRTYRTYRNDFDYLVVSWGDSHREKWSPMSCNYWAPEQVLYLVSHGYDLFGLTDKKRFV